MFVLSSNMLEQVSKQTLAKPKFNSLNPQISLLNLNQLKIFLYPTEVFSGRRHLQAGRPWRGKCLRLVRRPPHNLRTSDAKDPGSRPSSFPIEEQAKRYNVDLVTRVGILGGVNPGSWGRDSQILWWGVVVSPWNIIISYGVKKYETKTLSKMVTLQKWTDLCILSK